MLPLNRKRRVIGLHLQHIMDFLSDTSFKYKDKNNFLDIGCGDGTKTILFEGFGRKICGADCRNWLSSEVKSRIYFAQVDFVKNKLPFENETFDLVLSFDVIEHLPDPCIMLEEARRVLKKEGVFIISTPNRYRLLGFPLLLFGLRKFPYYPDIKTKSYDVYSAHITEYTLSGLKELIQECGFKVIGSHKLFYGLTGRIGLRSFLSFPFFHNIALECVRSE